MTQIEIDLTKIERGTHIGRVKVTRGGKTFWREQRVGIKEDVKAKIFSGLPKTITRDILKNVPDKHLSYINKFYYTNPDTIHSNIGISHGSAFADTDNMNVWVRDDLNDDERVVSAIKHEIGHLVDEKLNISSHADWLSVTEKDSFEMGYNYEENFAVAYEIYADEGLRDYYENKYVNVMRFMEKLFGNDI